MRTKRNDPCPCGSGRKHKRCCLGTPTAATAEGAVSSSVWRDLLLQAQMLHASGRLQEAMDAYERILRDRPRNASALSGLGQLYAQQRQPDAAIERLRQAVAVEPDNPRHQVQLAAALGQAGRLEAAHCSAARAVHLDPKSGPAQTLLALTLARMNRVREGLAEARRAVALSPDDTDAGVVLAGLLRRSGALDEAVERLESLLVNEERGDRRSRILRELGFAHDARGEHAAAFDAFAAAGREEALTTIASSVDREAKRRAVRDSRTAITPELLSRWSPEDFDDGHPRPTFLVGFPRSGTTMLERLLGAHPRVRTLEERPTIVALRRALDDRSGGEGGGALGALQGLDRDGVLALRALYWQRVADELGGPPAGGEVVVDKMPMAITDLGLINALFPEARAIVALRDPRDVCLSCFMQSFQLNESMVHFLDFARTASFYAEVMGLWLHQRSLLTLRWIEVRYESVVSALEPEARRMLELLDLPWDPSVLHFHESRGARHANTPSYAAVREPVHVRAIGRWRNYEDRFHAVRITLAPMVDALGYERFAGPREAA